MARTEEHVWFLQEWFATQGLKQRDLVTKLDWLPAKANKIWHGIQPFRREELVEVASLLNIAPHELLMAPEDAMSIRRLRSAIAEVVDNSTAADTLTSAAPQTAEKPLKRAAAK